MRAVVKTYTLSECMERMAEYAASYEQLGKEVVVFCEDRLTLIAERALARRLGGTFLSSVHTFSRFLRAEGKTLTKQGSVMLVGEAMTRLQRENALQCFTSTAGIGKNARCIYETIAQLAASMVTPDVLKESLALLPEDALKRKLSDLLLIYEGYLQEIEKGGYLDESRYLTLLPKRIREEGCLDGKTALFVGYSAFTAQAKETVRAALSRAENVVGVFCSDGRELYTSRAFDAFLSVCREQGETLVKDMGAPLLGEAERLRRGLFAPERPAMRAPTENICIFEAEDKTAEAEYVAVKIKRALCENPALRYRDFALLVPALASYALPLKKALAEQEIPFFLDEKKSMKEHPIARFLLDCFRVVKEGYSPESVQSLAGNFFFGESDEYRNYLYKFANYRGGAKRPVKTGEKVEGLFDIQKIESGRARVLLATEGLKPKATGGEYCKAAWKILQDFAVKDALQGLDASLEDVAQKGYLAQIDKALFSVLSEAETLLGNKSLTVGEFAALLEDGFDAMEISLIPLKADAVFVGEITESRIEKTAVLFALGLTDEVPAISMDTAIVSDREIARLAEVKTLLEPTVAEVNLRARECVGLNLCTFTDKLYLSYPLPANGDEPSVSEIFRSVDALFCEENGGNLLRRKKLSAEDFPYRCAAILPATRQMLQEKEEILQGNYEATAACSAVYTALSRMGVEGLDALWSGNEERETIAKGKELFFRDGKISPTSLEGYFACPFGHFAERGLRLKEREESAVLAVDSGNFIHLLLEKTAPKAKEYEREEDFCAYANEAGKELIQSSVYLLQQDTKAGAYSSTKLLKEGAEVALAAYRQIRNSKFEVEKVEAQVEGEFVRGKVDRIDVAGEYVRIIDYKTGAIDDSPTSYYTGQKLQMQLYMSKLKGERIPAGVFYFPASVEYGDEEEGRYRMKGFLNGAEGALRAGDIHLTDEKKSEYFAASLTNNKRLSKVMDEPTFLDFLDYGELVTRQGVKELQEGYIAPTPYQGSCQYCKYGGLCGFQKDCAPERKERAIEPSAIADVAKNEKEGE